MLRTVPAAWGVPIGGETVPMQGLDGRVYYHALIKTCPFLVIFKLSSLFPADDNHTHLALEKLRSSKERAIRLSHCLARPLLSTTDSRYSSWPCRANN